MTAGNEDTTGTAVEQVAPGALAIAQGHGQINFAELADKLLAPLEPAPLDSPFPQPPKPTAIPDGVRKALRAIPDMFGGVQPTERRKLEAAEVKSLTDEAATIAAITGPLGARLKDIQELMRMQTDFAAEAEGKNAERIAGGVGKGHWLAATPGEPFEVPVEGYEDAWQQRYVKGGTQQDVKALEALADDGSVTRQEYLAFTAEVRVLDETKMASFIRKHPLRGLEILKKITRRSAPGAAIYQPKK
jgi:hypothetical protein